ncbi:MAG: hypothetical protein AABW45_00760 [Nanoarchaeota archaeon]
MEKEINSGFDGYGAFNYISFRDMMKNLGGVEELFYMPLVSEESVQAYKFGSNVLVLCNGKLGSSPSRVKLFGLKNDIGEVEKIIIENYRRRLSK